MSNSQEIDRAKANSQDIERANSQDIERENSQDIERANSQDIERDNSQDIERANSQDIERANSQDIERENWSQITTTIEVFDNSYTYKLKNEDILLLAYLFWRDSNWIHIRQPVYLFNSSTYKLRELNALMDKYIRVV